MDQHIDADLLPLNYMAAGLPGPQGREQLDRRLHYEADGRPRAKAASPGMPSGVPLTMQLTAEQEDRDAIGASARVLSNGIAGHPHLAEKVAAGVGVTLGTLLGWQRSGIPIAELRGRVFKLIDDIEAGGRATWKAVARDQYLSRRGLLDAPE